MCKTVTETLPIKERVQHSFMHSDFFPMLNVLDSHAWHGQIVKKRIGRKTYFYARNTPPRYESYVCVLVAVAAYCKCIK